MRQYETVFLISPNLSEEETKDLIIQMAEIISKKKGKMISKEEWGKRNLAYPIKKLDEAFYVFFHYEGKPDIPAELERRFKQTDTIIRYLTLKKETKENVRGKKKRVSEKREAVALPDQGQQEPPSAEEVKEEK